jgi:hypothetical protein
VIFETEKKKNIYLSTYPLPQWYTFPIDLPVRRNPQAYKSFDCCLSHFRSSSSLREFPLYATNTSHRKQETFIYEYPLHWVLLPAKKEKRGTTLLLGSTPLKHGRHFDYWNQPLYMRVCYLDCHKAGLCCYLVIHIENLLRPLQLFYFYMWPIYWLFLVYCSFQIGDYLQHSKQNLWLMELSNWRNAKIIYFSMKSTHVDQLIKKENNFLIKAVLWYHHAVCVFVNPPYKLLNGWTNRYVCTEYNGTWAHLNGALHKSFPSVYVCLYEYPHVVVRQRLSKNVTAATNTQAKSQELLDASYSLRYVSYQRKIRDFENMGLIRS